MTEQISIRNAKPSDLSNVIALDYTGTKDEKSDYWTGIFDRYLEQGREDRIFLIAEMNNEVIGFIGGEVRAWEFGSPPCGWILALSVSENARGLGIGKRMFNEMCNRLKQAGITTVRTMAERNNKLNLSFFRSQGMRTGHYIELEKQLD